MRAAVLHTHGQPPSHADHPDPVSSDGYSVVRVTAAPVVPLDLLCASGTSYFGQPAVPCIHLLQPLLVEHGERLAQAEQEERRGRVGEEAGRIVADDRPPIEEVARRAAWFAARTYHLAMMPGMARRVRLGFDWAVGLVFGRASAELGQLGHAPSLGVYLDEATQPGEAPGERAEDA